EPLELVERLRVARILLEDLAQLLDRLLAPPEPLIGQAREPHARGDAVGRSLGDAEAPLDQLLELAEALRILVEPLQRRDRLEIGRLLVERASPRLDGRLDVAEVLRLRARELLAEPYARLGIRLHVDAAQEQLRDPRE